MSRLRVATLIDSLDLGGAESLAVNLLAARDTARFDDALLVLRAGGPLRERARAAVSSFACLGATHALAPGASGWVRRQLEALAPVVLHTHLRTSDILGVWASARVASRPRAVVTLHTTAEGYASGAGLRARAMWRAWRRIVAPSPRVAFVAISQAVRESFAPILAPRSRCLVIENGTPLARGVATAERDRNAARRALGLPEDAFVVLCVGGLRREKGQCDLVTAFSRALADRREAILLLAGDGPERQRLEAQHRTLALGERARLLGVVADPAPLMRAADVLALPSRREGFGLVLLEALSEGLPVVATAVDAVPGLIRDGEEGLLVPAEEPEVLGAALRRLALDPALRARLAAGARAKDLSPWSIERTAHAYEELYLELARG